MKRILVIGLLAILTITFSSCGVSDDKADPMEINVWFMNLILNSNWEDVSVADDYADIVRSYKFGNGTGDLGDGAAYKHKGTHDVMIIGSVNQGVNMLSGTEHVFNEDFASEMGDGWSVYESEDTLVQDYTTHIYKLENSNGGTYIAKVIIDRPDECWYEITIGSETKERLDECIEIVTSTATFDDMPSYDN